MSGLTGNEDGLQGYWKFNAGTDIIVYDYSGNLNRISDIMKDLDVATKKRVRLVHHDLRAEINEMRKIAQKCFPISIKKASTRTKKQKWFPLFVKKASSQKEYQNCAFPYLPNKKLYLGEQLSTFP